MKIEKVYAWVIVSVIVFVLVSVFGFFSLVSRSWDNTMTDKYLPVVIAAMRDIVLATIGGMLLAHLVPAVVKIVISYRGGNRQSSSVTLPRSPTVSIPPPQNKVDVEPQMLYRDITV